MADRNVGVTGDVGGTWGNYEKEIYGGTKWSASVHADRVVGGDQYHWDLGGVIASGVESCETIGTGEPGEAGDREHHERDT